MRRIAIINQKGGVGKTTTAANLGAALARLGRRVVLIDLDPQANLSLHLDRSSPESEPSTYTVLLGESTFADAVRATNSPNLSIVRSNIDLSGAELELASAIGRESLLRDAIDGWEQETRARDGRAPADYVLIDCPPSLGLLSINGLVASGETIVTLQTEFFALQGMSKLVDVLKLLQKRLNPALSIAGILPCMYDSRLKLAREVLSEIRSYFPDRVFQRAIGKNVKLAEAPSYGQTIFEYAPECSGASDYDALARELIAQETRDAELAALELPRGDAELDAWIERTRPQDPTRVRPPPPRRADSAARASRDEMPVREVEPLRDVVIVPPSPPAPAIAEDRAAGDRRAPLELDASRDLALATSTATIEIDRAAGSIVAAVATEPPLAIETLPDDHPVLARGGVDRAGLGIGPQVEPLESLPDLPDEALLLPDAQA